MTHLSSETFDTNARAALADETLRGALKKATDLFAGKRDAAVRSLPEWEALRVEARRIKDDALLNLDRYLEQFEEQATAAGARVHWARNAQEACEIVARIAKDAGARRLVKSKSMTTEEIHLNAALEREGTLPVETDLGEWIIQLAGEAPSHIIAPAIHKTKKQITDLFVEKLAIEPTDDIEELTRTARRILRQHFAESDLGVSGVNFAVAETGSILILENEGNARLTTSLPNVHVALMGIEKVIPCFDDLEVFLRLLPRSGTGQHLTSYQSILTGPGAPEGEGPAQLHVVILDNGRSGMLHDRVTRQSLACIRCGACLNVCPVYQAIGGHAYGSVYPGPIGAVITPQLSGVEKAAQLPFASSLCGACRDVCPVKIDIPELLLELRTRVVSGTGLPHSPDAANPVPKKRLERLAFRVWSWTMTSERRYRVSSWFARVLLRTAWGRAAAGRLFAPWRAWIELRDLRPPAARSFRELWKTSLAGEKEQVR
jgi:L-lactate dehydrogenase complex protein LldF